MVSSSIPEQDNREQHVIISTNKIISLVPFLVPFSAIHFQGCQGGQTMNESTCFNKSPVFI